MSCEVVSSVSAVPNCVTSGPYQKVRFGTGVELVVGHSEYIDRREI